MCPIMWYWLACLAVAASDEKEHRLVLHVMGAAELSACHLCMPLGQLGCYSMTACRES